MNTLIITGGKMPQNQHARAEKTLARTGLCANSSSATGGGTTAKAYAGDLSVIFSGRPGV